MIQYKDIIETRRDARMNGETVDHVVLTEEQTDLLFDTENLVTVDNDEEIDKDGSLGVVSGFDVKKGDRNALITEQGRVWQL